MDKKQKTMLVSMLIVLLLILLVTGYTFAKYNTSISGAGSLKIARWNFGVDGITVDDEGTGILSLIDISTTETKEAATMIAPGYQGKITLTLDASTTDVPVEYEIFATETSDKPEHMTFKAIVQGSSTEITADSLTELAGLLSTSNNTLAANSTRKIEIFAIWPYELDSEDAIAVAAYDAQDNEDGKANTDGTNNTYTFSLEVVGMQANPNN